MDFGFSGELIFLALLGLILFGPRKLPEIARKAGRFADDLKRARDQFQDQLKREVEGLHTEGRGSLLEDRSGKSLVASLVDDFKSFNSVREPAKIVQAVVEPVQLSLSSVSLSDNTNRIKELLAKQDSADSEANVTTAANPT